MYGFLAFDEYFGLVFADLGATTALVALLTAATAAAQAVGGVLAGPAAGLSARNLGLLTAGSAVLIGAGSALSLAPAVIGIALGYGVLQLVLVVTEARLQDSIDGPARATVTSVAGLGRRCSRWVCTPVSPSARCGSGTPRWSPSSPWRRWPWPGCSRAGCRRWWTPGTRVTTVDVGAPDGRPILFAHAQSSPRWRQAR